MRRPGISRPIRMARHPCCWTMPAARSTAWRNRSASAARSNAARPMRAKISRPTSAPAMLASTTAGTNAVAWTVPLAMAMPPMMSRMSPGAKGTGTPISSMKASAQMMPVRRSPSRSSKTSTGLNDIRLGRTLNQLRDERDGEVAAVEEAVVEGFQGEARLALRVPAHLVDQQLAERVIQVQGVEGPPGSFPPRRQLGLETLLHECSHRILHRHAATVETDGDQKTAVAQKRIHHLGEFQPGIILVAGLQHHLLAVVRPALPRALHPEQAAGQRRGAPFVQGLHVVAGVGLVDGYVLQHGIVEVAQPFLGLGGAPVRRRDGDVVVALSRDGLQRPGAVKRGAGPGHEFL